MKTERNITATSQIPEIISESSPWGQANKNRGIRFHDLAMAFVDKFPIGTALSDAQLDRWAAQQKQLKVPPQGTSKDADAWLAHLQRRHQFRYSLNKAGAHPRMTENGSTPFVVESVSQGVYEVRSPHDALHKQTMPQKVESLVRTKRKQLTYLMQSADWDQLPPAERIYAESLYDDIENFESRVDNEATMIDRKLEKLRSKLLIGIQSGRITPKNGGIKAMIEKKDK